MFLFNGLNNSGNVDSALQYASKRTGVDLGYLKTTAKRESNLDPNAKAGTSTATGLFQFIERTWLGMLKQAGGEHGYGELAEKIQPTSGGGFRVTDAKARKEILELRQDPKAAALMAGEFTAQNAETLRSALGREASEGELYAAHFLGARGAVELVRLTETAPTAPAADRFPAAAAANRPIFYTSNGQARSAAQVYTKITSGYGAGPAVHEATPAVPENATYLAFAPGRSSEDHVFHGLFRSEGTGLGPIGKSVSSFWSGFPTAPASFGLTENPGTATVETAAGSNDVTIRVGTDAASGNASEKSGETSGASQESGHTKYGEQRRYGRFIDDPSLIVR